MKISVENPLTDKPVSISLQVMPAEGNETLEQRKTLVTVGVPSNKGVAVVMPKTSIVPFGDALSEIEKLWSEFSTTVAKVSAESAPPEKVGSAAVVKFEEDDDF